MTDVYKSRSKELFTAAIEKRKDVILETVFNDASFKDLIDTARNAGYHTSLITLFLDTPQHSLERVAFRSIGQNGLTISGNNIRLNFNESFKNIATYFFYFDQSDFIYTGITGKNTLVMSFQGGEIIAYKATNLQYPQKFADFSFNTRRLPQIGHDLIKANRDYNKTLIERDQDHDGWFGTGRGR
jgi:predicted ABC-type ATPase